jgi:prevent-host-death family protein
MQIFSTDVVPITSARARLTEIAAEVVASGQPKVLTRNGESYVAVVGVRDLDEFQRLRAADHLRNLHDLIRAASEMAAGTASSAAAFRKRAATLVAGVARDRPAAPRKKAVKRQTRK